MITAGSVYIKSQQAKAKDVLADLLEMVKGVQHPQRGLFLRYFLAQKCKDKLPDVGSQYDGGCLQALTAAPAPPVAAPACPSHAHTLSELALPTHARNPVRPSRRALQALAAPSTTPSISSSPTLAR